ncbi:pheromone processing endoprotease [Rhizophlyctis rosea]|nr:pheromone processing endoprotease [Rhizophlyctis rosea]
MQFAEGSYDYNDHVALPKPKVVDDHHGTRCAGEVAAVRNDVCGVGVAYGAKVSGVRILSGALTEADEAASINFAYDKNHIYSCSWGPADDGKSVEAPPKIVEDALVNGVMNGRGGLGSLYVFASGNGGRFGDEWPDLTWRDFQHLTVRTAVQVNPTDPSWQRTHSGRMYSHKFGYGKLDAWAIVKAAKTYHNVRAQTHMISPVVLVNQSIPSNGEGLRSSITVNEANLGKVVMTRLEHVTVTVDIDHQRRGDVVVELHSPNGVISQLASGRVGDLDGGGFRNWTFMSVVHWDEDPVGVWEVRVVDEVNPDSTGRWNHWWLTLWGESGYGAGDGGFGVIIIIGATGALLLYRTRKDREVARDYEFRTLNSSEVDVASGEEDEDEGSGFLEGGGMEGR